VFIRITSSRLRKIKENKTEYLSVRVMGHVREREREREREESVRCRKREKKKKERVGGD
jgi:hypothetical protein